jgi:hypothetical protein
MSDWFPPFASAPESVRDPIPPKWRADVSLAARSGWLRQELLDVITER